MIPYEKLHFYGQKQKEKIILLTRRHWFILFKLITFFLFLFILPIVIYIFRPISVIEESFDYNTVYVILVLIGSIYYLFLWVYFFAVWINYYFDVWIVTNERIVNIEQVALFKRVNAEQEIIRVQDVTSEVVGIIPTFLDFGNVYVQTAGTVERFVFEEVPYPNEIKRIVLSATEEAIKKSRRANGNIENQSY